VVPFAFFWWSSNRRFEEEDGCAALHQLPGMAALAFDARHRDCFPASGSFAMLDPILFYLPRGEAGVARPCARLIAAAATLMH
jgi:hypothetical protein